MVLHLSISRRSNARKEPSAHGYPKSFKHHHYLCGRICEPPGQRILCQAVNQPMCPSLSGTVNDLKNAAQTSLRKGFLSCLGPGFKLDVFEYVFFPIGSVTFPTSLSLSLSLWIFGNLQRKSQVWTRRTTFGLRGASRFPPDLRGWLSQQQPTTNGGSPKGVYPKAHPNGLRGGKNAPAALKPRARNEVQELQTKRT